jgi:hypothetical protein
MRRLLFVIPLFVAVVSAQTMTEVGGAAAGGAIGSAAGKKVSEGITSIFGKVDATTKKAAKPEDNSKKDPLLEVGESTPKIGASAGAGTVAGGGDVPPPPPPAGYHRPAKPAAPEVMAEILPPPAPAPPPPPQVTSGDLRKVAEGMRRDDLLRLGAPGSRITMEDDGHLLETYSYYEKDTAIGRVKLTDGSVSKVEVW